MSCISDVLPELGYRRGQLKELLSSKYADILGEYAKRDNPLSAYDIFDTICLRQIPENDRSYYIGAFIHHLISMDVIPLTSIDFMHPWHPDCYPDYKCCFGFFQHGRFNYPYKFLGIKESSLDLTIQEILNIPLVWDCACWYLKEYRCFELWCTHLFALIYITRLGSGINKFKNQRNQITDDLTEFVITIEEMAIGESKRIQPLPQLNERSRKILEKIINRNNKLIVRYDGEIAKQHKIFNERRESAIRLYAYLSSSKKCIWDDIIWNDIILDAEMMEKAILATLYTKMLLYRARNCNDDIISCAYTMSTVTEESADEWDASKKDDNITKEEYEQFKTTSKWDGLHDYEVVKRVNRLRYMERTKLTFNDANAIMTSAPNSIISSCRNNDDSDTCNIANDVDNKVVCKSRNDGRKKKIDKTSLRSRLELVGQFIESASTIEIKAEPVAAKINKTETPGKALVQCYWCEKPIDHVVKLRCKNKCNIPCHLTCWELYQHEKDKNIRCPIGYCNSYLISWKNQGTINTIKCDTQIETNVSHTKPIETEVIPSEHTEEAKLVQTEYRGESYRIENTASYEKLSEDHKTAKQLKQQKQLRKRTEKMKRQNSKFVTNLDSLNDVIRSTNPSRCPIIEENPWSKKIISQNNNRATTNNFIVNSQITKPFKELTAQRSNVINCAMSADISKFKPTFNKDDMVPNNPGVSKYNPSLNKLNPYSNQFSSQFQSSLICTICFTYPIDVINYPCQHATLCSQCAMHNIMCTTCYGTIISFK